MEGRSGGAFFRVLAFLGATGAGEDTTFSSGSGSGLISAWGTGELLSGAFDGQADVLVGQA